ncbi:hypothetical protein Tco_1486914, partial [Tanacetum coccineum]
DRMSTLTQWDRMGTPTQCDMLCDTFWMSLVAYSVSYSKPECEVSVLRKVKLGKLASETVGLHAELSHSSCDVSWKKTEEYTKIRSLNEEVNSSSSFPTPVHCFGHNTVIRTRIDLIQAATEREFNYL